MDDLTRRAFDSDQRRTARKLRLAIADIRQQLLSIEDAIDSGSPLVGDRSRQLIHLASEVAVSGGALDTLVEWANVFDANPDVITSTDREAGV